MTSINKTGFRLTFDDEFNSFTSSADGSTGWMTAYPFGLRQVRTMPQNHERQCYTDTGTGTDPFRIAPVPGRSERPVLIITAAASAENPCGLPYSSGLLTTFGSFRFLYGYAEARMAVPLGSGTWPAFWLVPSDNLGRSELDVMETFGFDPAAYFATGIAQFDKVNDQSRIPLANPEQFHRYGVAWGPESISWFLDGAPVKTMRTPAAMHTPMYLLVNLAVYGAGFFGDDRERAMANPPPRRFPAQLLVSDIWVYRTPDTRQVDTKPLPAPIKAKGP